MKFLAILRDSLREAIDAKVFYVMLGLSLLLILLGATVTFTPEPGAEMIMKMAAIPLSIDLNNLDIEQMQRRGKGDPAWMLRRLRGSYEVVKQGPVQGQPDLPDSTFQVVVRANTVVPLGFLLGQGGPEKTMAQIRERFGAFDDMRIVEVLDVEHRGGEYILTTRLTPEGRRVWPHSLSLFYGLLPVFREGVPLGMQLFVLQGYLVGGIGAWITILVSVILTSFFIPNMLRKGTVDLMIVKPIYRVTLLSYKYIGGLLFILINTTVAVGGVWLVLSLRSGIWAPGFLLSIPSITFFFAILYSVSTLFAVLTRSPIVCIMVTCFVWFCLFVVGVTNNVMDLIAAEEQAKIRRLTAESVTASLAMSGSPATTGLGAAALAANLPEPYTKGWFAQIVATLHFVLPRTSDLSTLMDSALQKDLLVLPRSLRSQAIFSRSISWTETLTVSGVFIALMLVLSCWWFATKDY